MTIAILIVSAVLVAVVWLRFIRVQRPELPPLAIGNDDPLIIEAVKAARGSLDEFFTLFKEHPNKAQVKVPFLTSSGETEFLWGEVNLITDTCITVFLLTPPITHAGKVNRTQTYQLTDIQDWIVLIDDGKAKGGYTMKAMFAIAREKWGQLPPKLLKEEQKYL